MSYLYIRKCLYNNDSEYKLIRCDNPKKVLEYILLNFSKIFDDDNNNNCEKLIIFLRPIYNKIVESIPDFAVDLISTMEDNVLEREQQYNVILSSYAITDEDVVKLKLLLDMAIKHRVVNHKKIENFITKSDQKFSYQLIKCDNIIEM